jgi:hypothetical protein
LASGLFFGFLLESRQKNTPGYGEKKKKNVEESVAPAKARKTDMQIDRATDRLKERLEKSEICQSIYQYANPRRCPRKGLRACVLFIGKAKQQKKIQKIEFYYVSVCVRVFARCCYLREVDK